MLKDGNMLRVVVIRAREPALRMPPDDHTEPGYPNRRPAMTEGVIVGNMTLSASIGFDETGRARDHMDRVA
jgi:hypothetical protein